jgi:hypothetical protein
MACSIYYTSFVVALPVVVVTTAVAVVVLRFGIICKDPTENRSNLLVLLPLMMFEGKIDNIVFFFIYFFT